MTTHNPDPSPHTTRLLSGLLSGLLGLLGPACGLPEEDTGDASDASDSSDSSDSSSERVVTEELGDGLYDTVIDASHEESWAYFDFESRAGVEPTDPNDDPVWDLGALRFNIKTNSGTSGSGGAAVAILEGTRFDAVAAAPSDGYIVDAASEPGSGGGAMADTSPGYAFDNWFAYDPMTHTLSPAADRVYVVRTPEGNHYKVEMLGYYDDAGTPGFVHFRWARLP